MSNGNDPLNPPPQPGTGTGTGTGAGHGGTVTPDGSDQPPQTKFKVALVAGAGGVIGGVVGALIGCCCLHH